MIFKFQTLTLLISLLPRLERSRVVVNLLRIKSESLVLGVVESLLELNVLLSLGFQEISKGLLSRGSLDFVVVSEFSV